MSFHAPTRRDPLISTPELCRRNLAGSRGEFKITIFMIPHYTAASGQAHKDAARLASDMHYRGTSLIRNCPPTRAAIGP